MFEFARRSLLVIALVGLSGCGLGSANLRPAGGTLADCDGGPHCVSSLSADPDRRVEPLRYAGPREDARKRLIGLLAAVPSYALRTIEPDYLHVEVVTRFMRYVDDVEFLFSPREPRIDVRSSSRIGYYDFQINRERVARIRAAFERDQSPAGD